MEDCERARAGSRVGATRPDLHRSGVGADPVLGAEDGVTVNGVFFEPRARTHWHVHEVAQVLYVLSGAG